MNFHALIVCLKPGFPFPSPYLHIIEYIPLTIILHGYYKNCAVVSIIYSNLTGVFIEIPRSQNVSVGETAEFRCQHSIADGIRWKVNGSVLRPIDFPRGVHKRVENQLHILTIIGLPEYNGTEVVGDAYHFDGSYPEETEPAATLEGI